MPDEQFTTITISCDTCIMRRSEHCRDCVVTFVCDEHAGSGADGSSDALVFDLAEQRAVKLLAAAGLVPTLKHREAI